MPFCVFEYFAPLFHHLFIAISSSAYGGKLSKIEDHRVNRHMVGFLSNHGSWSSACGDKVEGVKVVNLVDLASTSIASWVEALFFVST